MTEQQLKKYTDKGYDQTHTNKHLSLIFLLNQLQAHYFEEMRDYLKEFGLDIFDLKRLLNITGKDLAKIHKVVNPLITTKENQLGFFKDFEDIEKKISEVLKGEK